jgi:hypothetical protein
MTLSELFSTLPPRENAGSISANRFEYQKDWSLCLLLQLHLVGGDYLIVLDMHEDVVVLNAAFEPKTAKFYQVKTLHGSAQKSWTRAALIKRKTGKKGQANSILGKLYNNKVLFKEYTERLAVVSNATYSIRLADGKKPPLAKKSIAYIDIHSADRKKLEDALQTELALPAAPDLKDLLFLEVSDLHIEKHSEHARGKLVDFLDKVVPERATPVATIYRLLIDEIRVKNDTTVMPSDFAELARLKGISRADFVKILDRTGVTSDPKQIWNKIEANLQSVDTPLRIVMNLKIAFRKVQTDRMAKQSSLITGIHSIVAGVTNEEASTANTGSLYALSELVLTKLKEIGFDKMQFDEDYIRALTMTSFYETGNI